MMPVCSVRSIWLDARKGGARQSTFTSYLFVRSSICFSSSTVAYSRVLSAIVGYPQMLRTPYRAKYATCFSLVGALWQPSFIRIGLPAADAGGGAVAARAAAPDVA